ncbi:diguanylate cyclase [Colwellia sp. MSW7]|uniref:diguanylate cyclase n=1 Tax=Colwellia maritima TaxID=2912588 RepID=A0ABS9WWF7_9GAMM|nr:GGDEF domain-containing protein [Colwellia maritima]MCI2282129.1 diguanylate cyclase [Colwellia maritima]
MKLAVAQLHQWSLPVNPINYAVSYEYCKNSKPLLTANIKHLLLSGKPLDSFFMEQLYKDFLLKQSKFRTEIISDLSSLFIEVQNNCQQSKSDTQDFIEQIDNSIPSLMSSNQNEMKQAISQLHKASITFKKQQQALVEQIEGVKIHAQNLSNELEEARKEICLDPITGLHNRQSMSKHVDTWLSDDADRSIAAIVISVDHFNSFSERFGALIGDVILSKIAKKVTSYVEGSGLPVRSASDEFIILLPDVDGGIANEIAQKIKQGVEKLRFVSVQSGVRLPKVSISCGISEMQNKETLNQLITRSRKNIF